MKKPAYLTIIAVMAAALSIVPVSDTVFAASSETAGMSDYPRIEHFEQGSVKVDFPTLESWPEFRILKAWLPVEVLLENVEQSLVGSVYVQVATDINFDQRTVHISDHKVLKTQFSDDQTPAVVDKLIKQAFQVRESVVPLDVLLRLLPEDFEIPAQGGGSTTLNFDPPVILVSETPLKLLSVDREPVRAPVEGTDLEFVVNTDWDVFYYAQEERWFVLNDGAWQHNNYLSSGGWTTTDKLPAAFNTLALNDSWKTVQKALPASIPDQTPIPFVISLESTELILLDGSPRLRPVENTNIQYVSNTQSDLFKQGENWYFLVSGRWFSSNSLDGDWQAVQDLPTDFARIPSDHEKGHVLFSVPGTRQAKLSLIEAALPHRVSISASSVLESEVSWVGEPRFEAIDTTQLLRGVNTPFQVIKHNNFYYLCHEGAWYFSSSPNGPWKAALQIPDEIYRIPATDPLYNVTFVKLDSEQAQNQDYVNYSYSSGYTGSFSTTVSVVYGTGWYYPSSVFWGPGYRPYYWRYGPTYGYNFGYHPVGAYYGRRGGYYNPWGGWYGRTTVTLTSPTVDFTHGYGSAWEGPLQTTPGDPTEAATGSLDEFLPKKESDGKEVFIDTSKDRTEQPAKVSAASLYAGSALSSNLYAGPGGEVYKHEDEEWSQYSEGNWSTMQSMEQEYRRQTQPRRKPEVQTREQWLPAHKRTLSRSELDRQELARQEGMENYSKYRMEKDSNQ